MAKFEFKAGNLVDIVSGDEMRDQIDRVVNMLAKTQRPPNSMHPTGEALTDASGNLAFSRLYEVPNGMLAVVHRINVEGVGYTRDAPLTSGSISFAVNDGGLHQIFVGLPASPSGATLPATIVDSVSAGQIVKQGDVVGVIAKALPANQALRFRLQVLLWETEG